MTNKALKILLVQTANMNLGDSILADNDYYLLKKALGDRDYDILRYSISSQDASQVKYVDAVIFAGGIIKCTNENFWQYMPQIIKEADKYNVPVFMSAIGVEKFYPDDERSVALKDAINMPCVKGISVRDDIDTLINDYLVNKDVKTYRVYDPAVWCKDTYSEHLTNTVKEDVIGLGITRELLFADYGNPQIDRQFQLDFWKGIIDELDKRNVKWKVFTNGDTYDEIFAKEVLSYVGHGEKYDAPLDAISLVKDISTFSSVIAGRMHSNIISFALSIPSIGFVWNQKLRFWSERIGYPQRFIDCCDLSAENVINAWEKAVAEGSVLKEEHKIDVYNALCDFVENFCIVKEKHSEKLPVSKHLVATSLGGIDIRYKSTNSKQAYEYSTKLGYKNFHVDLRLTADKKLVCINRWHKETFRIMNHPQKHSDNVTPLTFEEFKNQKYYNRFDTLSFAELLALSKDNIKKEGHTFILSFGKPSEADFKIMIDELLKAIKEHSLTPKNFYLRLEQKRDVNYTINQKLKFKLMFYAVDKKTSEEDTIAFLKNTLQYCKSKHIKHLYINHNEYKSEFHKLCKRYHIKCSSSTCVLTDKVVNNIKNSAHFVFNQYYDVEYINRLTR